MAIVEPDSSMDPLEPGDRQVGRCLLHGKASSRVYYSDRSLYGHDYLLAKIEPIVAAVRANRIFDLGCGNGSIANRLSKHASVTGIDISDSGVQIANRGFPHLKIEVGSVYDDLAAKYGRFPVVVSLEVVEHLFDPPSFAKTLFDLVQPGGLAIVSTPYHGYWKNLAISLTGKFDSHFTALRVGGHIKFWSIHTLHIAGRGGIHGDRISARRQNPGARKVDDRNRTEILTLC